MARRADQELNDSARTNEYGQYQVNIMDQMKQHWILLILVLVLAVIFWKYGMKKL